MPEEYQDLEALEQAQDLMDRRPVERAARAALERVEALRHLAELERQAERGAPQEQAGPPVPLAEQARGLVPGALPVGTEHLLAALERAQAVDPVVSGPVAARPAVVNPLAAVEQALALAGCPAVPDLSAGLAQWAGPRWAETLRQAVEPHQAGPEYPAAAQADPAEADLYRRQEVMGLVLHQEVMEQVLRQEAALLHQAVADLVARLSAELVARQAEPDLVALSRLAGADPAETARPEAPDLPEADRAAALHRAVSRRLAVLHPQAGPDRLELMSRQVAARLAARPAGE